jgi:hypothetical protein
VVRRGLEVLAERHELDTRIAQLAKRIPDLLGPLAHPQDDVGLGDLARAEPLRQAEHVQGPLVVESGPDPLVQPADRLQVVGEHVGL